MKILFNTYPSAFQIAGGGEKQLLQYFKYLKSKKIYIEKFNPWSTSQKIENFDIIHFFSVMPGGAASFLRNAKNLKKKIIISPNAWIEKDELHPDFDEIKYCLHLADKIIVNSKLEAKLLSHTFELDINLFSVIYNFVDNIFFKKKKVNIYKKYKINKPFILTVGNIEKRKNQLKIAEVSKNFNHIIFINIGNIREKEYYKEILNIKSENFLQLGFIKDRNIIKNFYQNCEIFLMPSEVETPSIAALEAASCGAKIIITSKGSASEYFKNKANYVSPNISNINLQETIIKTLKQKKNLLLRKLVNMSFSESIQMNNLIILYKNLIKS